jgi:hypothetical protein
MVEMMLTDDLRRRFLAEIDKRAVDDKYIDAIEERELLQIAIQHGFGIDMARSELIEACREKGYVIESSVIQLIRDRLQVVARNDGTLDRTGFESVVAYVRENMTGANISEREVRRLVVTTLEDDNTIRARKGFFTNWYARVKKELGTS